MGSLVYFFLFISSSFVNESYTNFTFNKNIVFSKCVKTTDLEFICEFLIDKIKTIFKDFKLLIFVFLVHDNDAYLYQLYKYTNYKNGTVEKY